MNYKLVSCLTTALQLADNTAVRHLLLNLSLRTDTA